MSYYPILPDPEDKSPGQLRPQKKEGVFLLEREPRDTEIKLTDPDGDSYLLEFFQCEDFLRGPLQLPEVESNKILDTVWNFNRARFDTRQPEIIMSQ
jgi:hypothetical protein